MYVGIVVQINSPGLFGILCFFPDILYRKAPAKRKAVESVKNKMESNVQNEMVVYCLRF